MKNKILTSVGRTCRSAILASALIIAPTLPAALTPIAYKAFNSDGTAQTNPVVFQVYPPTANAFTIYGTNIIYGAGLFTNLPNATGFFSNNIYAGTYKVTIPALQASFFVTIPDTNVYQSLSLYMTNAAVVSGPGSGFQLVINYLGYTPATNSYDGIVAATGFAPATNTYAGITSILGFQPATNGYDGISITPGIASAVTNNGLVWLSFRTNGVMGTAYTNLPYGSLCTTTNGQLWVLSNAVWLLK